MAGMWLLDWSPPIRCPYCLYSTCYRVLLSQQPKHLVVVAGRLMAWDEWPWNAFMACSSVQNCSPHSEHLYCKWMWDHQGSSASVVVVSLWEHRVAFLPGARHEKLALPSSSTAEMFWIKDTWWSVIFFQIWASHVSCVSEAAFCTVIPL